MFDISINVFCLSLLFFGPLYLPTFTLFDYFLEFYFNLSLGFCFVFFFFSQTSLFIDPFLCHLCSAIKLIQGIFYVRYCIFDFWSSNLFFIVSVSLLRFAVFLFIEAMFVVLLNTAITPALEYLLGITFQYLGHPLISFFFKEQITFSWLILCLETFNCILDIVNIILRSPQIPSYSSKQC